MDIIYQTSSEAGVPSPVLKGIFEPASVTPGMRWPMSQRIVQFELTASNASDNPAGELIHEPTALRLRFLYEISSQPKQYAPFRYLLGCSVDALKEPEFHRWYDEEHLPGLAAVRGTIKAARYRSIDATSGQTRWFAEYHVIDPSIVGSPDWLKVRHTSWSNRIIPHMRDVERTMLREISH